MHVGYLDFDRMWAPYKVLMLNVLWMVRMQKILVIDSLCSFLLPAKLPYCEKLNMPRSFVLLVELGFESDTRLSVDFLSEAF